MRMLSVAVLFTATLLGQSQSWETLEGPTSVNVSAVNGFGSSYVYAVYRAPDGTKILDIQGFLCETFQHLGDDPETDCTPNGGSATANWGPVKRTVENFKNRYGADGTPTQVNILSLPVHGSQTALTSRVHNAAAIGDNSPLASPKVIVLEAKSDAHLLLFDPATLTISNTVTLPNGSRTFGVRPSETGEREVWTAHAGIGNQITITDLNAAKILGAIPTKLDENAAPVNIVFTNSGKMAYYVVQYLNPDVNGSLGAMLVYDVQTRTLKSTLPLAIRAASFLMSPDGLTAYVIGDGKIVYYDVLSGTADLTASFPGIVSSPVQHPDGNRIFTLQTLSAPPPALYSYAISVFDVSQRKVVSTFPIKFAAGGVASVMELSKDGNAVTILSNKDEVQNIDVITGKALSQFQSLPGTSDVFTTPVLQ